MHELKIKNGTLQDVDENTILINLTEAQKNQVRDYELKRLKARSLFGVAGEKFTEWQKKK